MSPAEEVKRGLAGALRMAQFRPEGVALFDISADGFWNSFIAMPICAALQVLTLFFPGAMPAEQRTAGNLVMTAVVTIITLLAVVGAMLPMAKLIKKDGLYSQFVIVFNWCNVAMFASVVLMSLAESFLLGSPVQGAAYWLAFIYTQVLTWFILRHTLVIDMLLAFLLMVFILAIQLLVNYGIADGIQWLSS